MSKAAQRNITWQELVLVLLVMVLFAGAVMAWGGNIDPGTRPVGKLIFFGTLPVMALLGIWDYRRLHRRDLLPDILLQSSPAEAIFDVGAAHFTVDVRQLGGAVCFTCDIQNRFHAVTKFELKMLPFGNFEMLATQPPILGCLVPPSQVVRATLIVPLRDPSLNGPQAKWQITASSGHQRGRQVRFARRTAITTRIPPAFTVLLLFAGHLAHGGGTFASFYPVRTKPGDATPRGDARWSFGTLWKPSSADEAELQQRL